MIEYMEETLGNKETSLHRRKFMNSSYLYPIETSVPIMAIALRYNGSYFSKLKSLGILVDVAKNYPRSLLMLNFYVCLIVCFVPRVVLKSLYQYYIEKVI